MKTTNAADIVIGHGTYLIYGAPGMGKTSTIKYLPGKTLVLDVDRTSKVLKGCNNIDICYIDNTDTWDDWCNTIIDLSKNYQGQYDNIVVDNVSELEKCILSDFGRKGKNQGVPAQGDYQKMQFRIVDSLRYLKQMDCNVILTAWETTTEFQDANGQMFSRVAPQINNKIVNEICGLCDVVGRIVVNAEGKRGYILTASNSVYAKNQLDDRKGCLQEELIPNASA